MLIVNEPCLYRLIMRSRTSEGRSSGVQGRVASHAFLAGSFFSKAEGEQVEAPGKVDAREGSREGAVAIMQSPIPD